MSKIPALTPRKIIVVLEKAGFCFIRQKGSHRMYMKGKTMLVIPYHNKDLKKGTIIKIIKQTGLTLEEFLDLM